ncbi:hypothetical protein SO802_001862 [Lithocarpus litseifolius]|uniref:Uncharacterized protein n=1 Tax=Lithocarpus litseifolius TaxID=425828 RepID=A0AAW2DVW1_9ROSI
MQRIWSRLEGRLKRESKSGSQASSSNSKPIIVLKPLSIEGTPQILHLNSVFDLQDSHKKSEDSITMVEGKEHQNTEEPMSTQELLKTMMANQIQLREVTNIMIQQFQNLQGSQEENKNNQNLPISKKMDVTRRDLETTKQEPKESFSTCITKWRAKAAEMITRPSKEKQIQMVVKNLLPIFQKHLFGQYFPNFKALVIAGTQVEDAINNSMLKNEEGFIFEKVATHTTNEEAINVVVLQTL